MTKATAAQEVAEAIQAAQEGLRRAYMAARSEVESYDDTAAAGGAVRRWLERSAMLQHAYFDVCSGGAQAALDLAFGAQSATIAASRSAWDGATQVNAALLDSAAALARRGQQVTATLFAANWQAVETLVFRRAA